MDVQASKANFLLGHTSAFSVRGNPPVPVHTHAIVVRNAGRATANQVRIGHHFLPENFQIHPPVPHTVERAPNGSGEIIIPKMVSAEQVTISYLYFPPLLWSQIHAYTKSDKGFAKILTVLPTPQFPKWVSSLLWALIFVGVVSLLYLVVGGIQKISAYKSGHNNTLQPTLSTPEPRGQRG